MSTKRLPNLPTLSPSSVRMCVCVCACVCVQVVYPPLYPAAMHKLFSEQESERVKLVTCHLTEQVIDITIIFKVSTQYHCSTHGMFLLHVQLLLIPDEVLVESVVFVLTGPHDSVHGRGAAEGSPACHQRPHPSQCLLGPAGKHALPQHEWRGRG